ncbi:tetratricopeptide repeat protein [Phycisphaerales bacterium AB-hyl4]|uniref:Tetratricopeptide repeat protein n=1 Tax=Natronomicrosphaera hydrolytica TaxID=3242702 RepID=A0ABV4UBB9_9BACT
MSSNWSVVVVAVGVMWVACAGSAAADESVEARLHEARQLYADGAYADAAAALSAIVEERPDVAAAHLFKGHALYALERFDEARGAYARAIEAGRLDAAMLGRLAQIEQRADRRGSALSALRLLLLVTPGEHDLHLAVAEASAAAGLPGEAAQLYEQVIRARPSDAGGHLRLANLHLSRDRWREAIGPMTLAYHLGEAAGERARTLGDLHMRADQPTAAAAWYERAIDDGLDTSAMQLRLAQAWLAHGDREAARAAATRAAEADDTSADGGRALLLLGQLAREAGEIDEAVRYWQRAAERADVPRQVHVYLGTLTYERERFGEAAAHLAAARAAGDVEPTTLRLLVLSYAGQGERERAREMLQVYVERYGMDEAAAGMVRRLLRIP